MADIKGMQQETMANIDTAKAMIDKVLTIMSIIGVSSPSSITFATNPIGFALQLLKHLGVKYDDIKQGLMWFLCVTLPYLELSVKAILLTNLKNMISCSVDPRIPDKYRKAHKDVVDDNTSQEYGIDIDIESIDFLDKLSINPLGEVGDDFYFGLEGVDDVYKLARADDFDAFLWFVIHKGKFPNASTVTTPITNFQGVRQVNTDETLFGAIELTASTENPSKILLGDSFKYDGGRIYAMCIDRKFDDTPDDTLESGSNNIVSNTLVPVSDDWSSVNWYTRGNAQQIARNMGVGWIPSKNGNTIALEGRDYSKERAICNLQYIDQASSDAPLTGLVNNKIRFTILPKAKIHTPSGDEPVWRFRKLLYDSKGNYTLNGKNTLIDDKGGNVDAKSGKVSYDKENDPKNMIECYPGLTVYEFNYDYVMSIRLFDAKSIASALFDALFNTRVGITLTGKLRHQEATDKIKEIIKNVINTDEENLRDCYYTFDNSKYELLLRKAEEKRAKQEKFGNTTREVGSYQSIKDVLKDYDTNATLEKRMETLSRAVTQASAIISEGARAEDKFEIEYNFVFDLIENLVTAIVNSILSPKVMMLLEINQTIMGGKVKKITMQDFLEAMASIIVAIVKEVRDLVLQEILKMILKELEPIIQTIHDLLLREQLDNYAEAIQEIIRNCPVIWFRFGNQDLETKLDTVDYADIDVSKTKEGEQPTTNNC